MPGGSDLDSRAWRSERDGERDCVLAVAPAARAAVDENVVPAV